MTTTPEEFGRDRARDLILSLLGTEILRRSSDPAEMIQRWRNALNDLKGHVHDIEFESAQKFLETYLGVCAGNAGISTTGR